jgi:hypothetical protein
MEGDPFLFGLPVLADPARKSGQIVTFIRTTFAPPCRGKTVNLKKN